MERYCEPGVKVMATVMIPRRLAEEAIKRGLDLEELVFQAIAKALDLDPQEVAEARVELAEKMLKEAEEYIAKKDIVQASEKLYKVVEECIKALAEKYGVKQLEVAEKKGKWDTWLLGQAATDLSKILREERIRLAWKDAYDIHVWGFHEAKYRIEDVEAALPLAKWILEYTKKTIRNKQQQTTTNKIQP